MNASLKDWFKEVQPMCVELFNAAHLMCGNYDLAEYALHSAILDVWLQNATGGMGFRERLRSSLRREAFDAALSAEGRSAEFTWPGVPAPTGDDPIMAQLAAERVEVQRLVLLRHGCGLSPRAISRLTGLGQGALKAELNRFEARCRRRLPRQQRVYAEAGIARAARKLLATRGPDAPPVRQLYRAFEAEADGAQASGRGVSRVVGSALLALTALLCAGAFWLFAVLVRPA